MVLEEQVGSYYFLGLALFVFVLSECEFICNSVGMVKAILSKKDIKGTELEKPPFFLGFLTPLFNFNRSPKQSSAYKKSS